MPNISTPEAYFVGYKFPIGLVIKDAPENWSQYTRLLRVTQRRLATRAISNYGELTVLPAIFASKLAIARISTLFWLNIHQNILLVSASLLLYC